METQDSQNASVLVQASFPLAVGYVLIIDDSISLRTLAKTMLESQGFHISEASGGKEGMALLDERRFDAVVLDLRMPDMDGHAVCRAIRSRAEYSAIPIMVVSGETADESIERAYEGGATDYLTKPVNWTRVGQKLGLMIAAEQARNQLVCLRDENQALAYMDTHTGLGNRTWIQQRCAWIVQRAQRENREVEVFRLLVENAPTLREVFGEKYFEALMKALSGRLVEEVGASPYTEVGATLADTEVGRSADGEFTVVRIRRADSSSPDDFAERLIERLQETVHQGRLEMGAKVRAGVADSSACVKGVENLFHLAGIAAIESSVGAGVKRYDKALVQGHLHSIGLESRMRKGLRGNEFHLFYQPQFAEGGKKLAGFEALVRWQSGGESINPGEFIPVAESSGLILELGDRVLEMACAQIAAWRAEGLQVPPVAINLSALQMAQNNVSAWLQEKLRFYSLPADSIEVEITESSLMENGENVQIALHRIRADGIRIALDDFGTGYSSLAYLHQYPMDVVKIDRSFVAGLEEVQRTADIIRAIVAMARAMGMQVVAEGVETTGQLDFLEEIGCDFVQGYLTGRPLTSDLARRLLLPVCNARQYSSSRPA